MSICVIGAGIIGLPTAVYIQENEPNCKVSVLSNIDVSFQIIF